MVKLIYNLINIFMKNKKIIISNIIINIIPLFVTLLHFYMDLEWKFLSFSNFLFTYNFSNSWLMSILLFDFNIQLIKLIIILSFNFILILLLNKISNFTKNYLILIITIFSIFTSLFWIIYLWIMMSV